MKLSHLEIGIGEEIKMINPNELLRKDIFGIDASEIARKIEEFIATEFLVSNRNKIVVPISGGLDSSVVVALCVRDVGPDKVVGLMLPELFGNPEANRYGIMIAKSLGIETKKINITPAAIGLGGFDPFFSLISGRKYLEKIIARHMAKRSHSAGRDYMAWLQGDLDKPGRKVVFKVNSKQRIRLLITYKYADKNNCLVAGSSHQTEVMVGLFCKYGIDDCADIMPLKNLYRSHIVQLADYLEIPPKIRKRTPNPDIVPGVTDKYRGYFGLTSELVELIIVGYLNNIAPKQIATALNIDDDKVEAVILAINLSEPMRNHSRAPEFDFYWSNPR